MKTIKIKEELETLVKNEIGEKYYPMEINSTIVKNKYFNKNIVVNGFGIYDSDTPKINSNRYYLEFDIDLQNNDNMLVTLMMNPSKTFPDENRNAGIDKTVQNVIRIAYSIGCSKVVILNTIPIINSDPIESSIKLCKLKQEKNNKFVNQYIKNCKKKNNVIFLAAWGSNFEINRFNNYIENINNAFKGRIYAYGINSSSKTPSHPNGRGGTNPKSLRNCLKNKKLIEIIEIDANNLTVTTGKIKKF